MFKLFLIDLFCLKNYIVTGLRNKKSLFNFVVIICLFLLNSYLLKNDISSLVRVNYSFFKLVLLICIFLFALFSLSSLDGSKLVIETFEYSIYNSKIKKSNYLIHKLILASLNYLLLIVFLTFQYGIIIQYFDISLKEYYFGLALLLLVLIHCLCKQIIGYVLNRVMSNLYRIIVLFQLVLLVFLTYWIIRNDIQITEKLLFLYLVFIIGLLIFSLWLVSNIKDSFWISEVNNTERNNYKFDDCNKDLFFYGSLKRQLYKYELPISYKEIVYLTVSIWIFVNYSRVFYPIGYYFHLYLTIFSNIDCCFVDHLHMPYYWLINDKHKEIKVLLFDVFKTFGKYAFISITFSFINVSNCTLYIIWGLLFTSLEILYIVICFNFEKKTVVDGTLLLIYPIKLFYIFILYLPCLFICIIVNLLNLSNIFYLLGLFVNLIILSLYIHF